MQHSVPYLSPQLYTTETRFSIAESSLTSRGSERKGKRGATAYEIYRGYFCECYIVIPYRAASYLILIVPVKRAETTGWQGRDKE